MKIWLDDVRETPEGWVRFKTAESLIDFLSNNFNLVEEISFDHDLGENVETGYDVLTWIEEYVFNHRDHVPVMTIHSDNGPGIKNMRAAIESIWRFGFGT